VISKSGAVETTGHPVAGESVSPNTIGGGLGFVVTHEQLSDAIAVNVSVSGGVGSVDLGLVDDAVANELAGFGRDAVEAHLLVEEFCGENDNFVLKLRNVLYLEGDIGS
jgi:hypothetical protein